ncbi:MAG TPA: DUF488 family protein [Bryobacterales bacterium]|nr:DUF488 family protein [Bryobacterales bacterium]
MIRVKRVYDPPEESDGVRVFVDRLWPRGLSKDEARIYLWLRDLAPSNELRRWFAHRPERWTEFKTRYYRELPRCRAALEAIREFARSSTVTLLYAARDTRYNNAVALREYIERELASAGAAGV